MRRLQACLALCAALLAAGCTTTPGGVPVDKTLTAKGQDSRVLFLVLHYTVTDTPTSIKILTQQEVSSHYLVTDEDPIRIYQLVDENRRAWHSGASFWKGNRLLNSSSIGIEIVHPGFKRGSPDGPDYTREFEPFTTAQIDKLLPLVRDIVARHQIRPERILGHGEVSPAYKIDPGPSFPWKRLAEEGITPPLPDAGRVAAQQAAFTLALPDIAWVQRALAEHGYNIQVTGVADEQMRRVLMNFQMRYRPALYDGVVDAESAALLQVLTGLPAPAAPLPTTAPGLTSLPAPLPAILPAPVEVPTPPPPPPPPPSSAPPPPPAVAAQP